MRTNPTPILLVEGQKEYVDLIRRVFQSCKDQYSLDFACNLEEAQKSIRNKNYNLVITDLHLSDGDGTEFLKNQNDKKSFPVIIMTGFSDEFKAVNAIKAGALDYIIKTDESLIEMPKIIERSLRKLEKITELKKAEEALKESEAKYSMLVESLKDGIKIIQDGMIKYVNKAGAEISGYTVEELINKPLLYLVAPEYKKKVTDILISGDKIPEYFTTKGIRKDGSIIDLEISQKTINYNDKPALLGIVRDITERKRIEDALLESEEKYRTLQENLPVGITRTSIDGQVLYANPALVKIFGYESKEDFASINVINLYADQQDRKKLIDTLMAERSVINFETQMRKKDGTVFWASTSIKATFNENGRILFLDGFCKDITGRKITENTLKKSEELYSALFQHNPIPTVVVDNEGRIIAFNKVKALSGDRLPNIGELMYKDYAGHHSMDMRKELLECILSGKMREFPEQEYLDRILSIKISPFKDGAIITSQDITFQKRAEEELRKSEERFRLITDNMLDLVSMCDSEEKIIYKSPSFEQILGYAQNENLGELIFEKVHPDDLSYLVKKCNDLKSHQTSAIYRYRHKDGHYLWLETYGHSIINSNGEYIGSVFSSRDITSRKMAEEKIEHLNELLFAIRDVDQLIAHEKNTGKLIQGICDCLIKSRGHTNVWIALTDNSNQVIASSASELNSKFLLFLKKLKNIASLSCHNLIKNNSEIAILDDDSVCRDCRFTEKDQHAGRVVIRLEYNKKTYGIMNVGVLPEFIAEEQEISLLEEVANDIAFGLYNIDLEKERKELQKQLYSTARLSAVGQLAAGIAHEFNNLLSVILGHTQLSLEEDSIDDIKQSLKEIEKTTKRGSGIVIKLAAFAKPKEPDFKTQDITKVIEDVLLLQKRQLHLESIKIETKFNAKSKISLDRGQMEQVFLNLLINSIHAIKPKGRGKIIITTEEINRNMEIRFSDNGIGMDKDTKSKVFDPFFTTKGAWAKNGLGISGTGLGLSITHSIIKQHNGSILIKSQKNKGTTFIIKLPINVSDQVAEEHPGYNISTHDIEKIKGMRILLVDDEDEMVEVFKQLFKKAGFENFKIENNGEKAVSIFTEFKPDIVFLDIIMPKMNGEKIFKQIKTINNRTPVVFMSGKVDAEKNIYLKNGAFDYIQKPFEINAIYSILNRIKKRQIQ